MTMYAVTFTAEDGRPDDALDPLCVYIPHTRIVDEADLDLLDQLLGKIHTYAARRTGGILTSERHTLPPAPVDHGAGTITLARPGGLAPRTIDYRFIRVVIG